MALPQSRVQLKTYIKRRLGEPVITVNVADDQLEERIDDAIAFFQDFHFSGQERVFLKHKLTFSNLVFASATTGTFANNEYVRGMTSNCLTQIHTQVNSTVAEHKYPRLDPKVPLQVGETIVGQTSGATGVLSALQKGDWENQCVPMSPLVLSVVKLLPLDGFAVDRGTGLFSWNYQFLINDLSWLSSSSVVSYYLTRSHMEMLNDLFIGDHPVRFNRHENKLYIELDWNEKIKPGDYIVVEAFRAIDPNAYADFWTDRYVRDYATALVRRQWGMNLLKFEGVQMPGGVSLNGRAIYDEAVREIEKLEQQIVDMYQTPPEFYVMGIVLPLLALAYSCLQGLTGILG